MKRKGRTHKPDAWMPLFIADYLADTGRLTTEGHGAYMLLIMEYWRAGGPLADDDAELAAVCRMPVERWMDLRRTLAKFFVVEDGVWRHGRIDDELKIAWANHEAAQKRSAAANSSKAPSRSRQGAADVTPEAPSSPSPSPVEETPSLPSEARPPEPRPDPRGSRLPDGWTPSEALLDWSTNDARAPPDLIEREVAKFRDYWRSKAGKDGRKLDWDGTWRNWLRRSMENGNGGKQPRNDHDDRRAEQARALTAAIGRRVGAGQSAAAADDG